MSKPGKILIVEDNEANLTLALRALRNEGYVLLTARTGPEAISVATAERPDVILMDIRLPEMDGLQVARALRDKEETKGAHILALTAHAMKGDEEIFKRAGCDGYLAKPYALDELRKRVREGLAEG